MAVPSTNVIELESSPILDDKSPSNSLWLKDGDCDAYACGLVERVYRDGMASSAYPPLRCQLCTYSSSLNRLDTQCCKFNRRESRIRWLMTAIMSAIHILPVFMYRTKPKEPARSTGLNEGKPLGSDRVCVWYQHASAAPGFGRKFCLGLGQSI